MNFLQEFEQLRLKTPRLYNINVGSENSDYCTHSDKNKDCYLLFAANYNRDCLYGGIVISSQDCVDCNECENSELCYECIDIDECYNCNYSQDLKNSSDCSFCYDCIGCKNCFGCAGLRQKEYYFFNERLSKADYVQRVQEFDLKNREHRTQATARHNALMEKTPRRATHIVQSENCTGEFISKSKNCTECFGLRESQDCVYIQDAWRLKDAVDCTFMDGAELCYECFSGGLNTYNCNFCSYIRTCSNCEYCELCFNCKNCFGCVGLQNKEYHILNVPYSPEEYFKKVAEIKAEMRAEDTYGKQLPSTYKLEDTAALYWK